MDLYLKDRTDMGVTKVGLRRGIIATKPLSC